MKHVTFARSLGKEKFFLSDLVKLVRMKYATVDDQTDNSWEKFKDRPKTEIPLHGVMSS